MTGFLWKAAGDILLTGKISQAVELAFRKALKVNPNHPVWNARVGSLLLRRKSYQEALTFYQRASSSCPKRAGWHFGSGKCLLELKRNSEAARAFETAIRLSPNIATYYSRLATALRRQGKIWQEVEALQTACRLETKRSSLFYHLGKALSMMGRHQQAAGAFQCALALNSKEATWHFCLGLSLEKSGDYEGAIKSYKNAQKLDVDLNSKRFGMGVYHEKFQRWDKAAKAYAAQVAIAPLDAELQYRLGRAYEKTFQWTAAISVYLKAVELDPSHPEWHFRLGFAYEMSSQWLEAANAYQYAASNSKKHNSRSFYRAGYAYTRAQDWQKAVDAFLRTDKLYSESSSPKSSDHSIQLAKVGSDQREASYCGGARYATSHFQQGLAAEKLGNFDEASKSYRKAVARQNKFTSDWYYRLGFVLASSGHLEEACEAFLNTRILRAAHGLDESKYQRNATLWKMTSYREYYQNLKVDKSVVLYEAFAGRSISCNPYALFKYALTDNELSRLTHVWCVDDLAGVPESYGNSDNVIFVLRESDLYLRYLASARILINNTTFPVYYVRKPDQIYLNTWHGTPWKTLGSDMKGRFFEHKNFARNILQTTHLLSPNKHTTNVFVNRHGIPRTINTQIVELGYPRVDLTLDQSEAARRAVKARLRVPDSKPIVFYAPTWRGTLQNTFIDCEVLLADLKKLSSNNYVLLFRGHYLQERALKNLDIGCLAEPSVDTNEILSVADILITDYSSVLFDYAPLNRPIALYIHDFDQYSQDRGLYFTPDQVPGISCKDIHELVAYVSECLRNLRSSDHQSFKAAFFPHEDGSVSQKVWRQIQEGSAPRQAPDLHRVLFYAGPFMPNGITSSTLNLMQALSNDSYEITLAIEADQIANEPQRLERITHVPSDISIFSRSGAMVMTLEERRAINEFNKWNTFYSSNQHEIYFEAFRFEFRRLFGETWFSAIVNFEGYSRFWAALLASSPASQSLVYLHNDMMSERLVKYPDLAGTAELYRDYDKLISVSKTMAQVNAANLSHQQWLPVERFDFANNLVDYHKIFRSAEEPIDSALKDWMADRKVFATLGRLSPEKDHEKLIKAFKSILTENRDICLVIVGDGPLRSKLEEVVHKDSLNNAVIITGLKANPFPLLKRAHCFVLSSNYEGLPMVLLEAMVLGKPIVATDIDGNRGILKDGHGLLVTNDVDGLADGMRSYLRGELQAKTFDYASYNRTALDKFEQLVCATAPMH